LATKADEEVLVGDFSKYCCGERPDDYEPCTSVGLVAKCKREAAISSDTHAEDSAGEAVNSFNSLVGLSKFRCIVADPPWPIGNFPAWFAKERRSKREKELGVNPTPYKTMSLPEIERLSVADVSADGGHLYLWTTDAFYEDALRVARAWGFEKSATLVWCKKPMGKGMGGIYPSNIEFVLFCRRVENPGWKEFGVWLREKRVCAGKTTAQMCAALGAHGTVNHGGMQSNWENGLSVPTLVQWQKMKPLLVVGDETDAWLERLQMESKGRADSRWYQWPRGKHSKKPEAFQDIVETVSPGPYLELFARRPRIGWTVWGDDVVQEQDTLIP
jgi:N6-adenosine-specific RNA methylase IME4